MNCFTNFSYGRREASVQDLVFDVIQNLLLFFADSAISHKYTSGFHDAFYIQIHYNTNCIKWQTDIRKICSEIIVRSRKCMLFLVIMEGKWYNDGCKIQRLI